MSFLFKKYGTYDSVSSTLLLIWLLLFTGEWNYSDVMIPVSTNEFQNVYGTFVIEST